MGLIKGRIDPLYNSKISLSQCGAVPGRGADLAAHAARSILSYASQMNWSVRMVFIELPNAFDKIVRDLVVGWPDHLPRDVRVTFRTSMGVSCRAASHIHDYLKENGCLFEQWGVDELCTVLLRTLHVGSWFSVGLTSAVKYGLGGRQGCKVGATMSNGAYDIPLASIKSTLEADGLALNVKRVGGASCMSPSGKSDETVTVLDSAFIGDVSICDPCAFC